MLSSLLLSMCFTFFFVAGPVMVFDHFFCTTFIRLNLDIITTCDVDDSNGCNDDDIDDDNAGYVTM